MDELNRIFSIKLKEKRIECGLTQKKLAESIGYSEKTVSCWESGTRTPPIDTLILLSERLSTSINELVTDNSAKYLLGIDGGATKTVFALAGADCKVLRTVSLSSSNPNDIGMDNAKEILKSGIAQVCANTPLSRISMFAGLSGGTTGHNLTVLNDFFNGFGFAAYACANDVESVIVAGLQGSDGIVVIMGTGSITYSVCGGKRRQFGGWGYLFEDGGSGYSIGRDAIRASLKEYDGTGERTLVSEYLKKLSTGAAVESLDEIYKGGKSYIASFAPTVFDAYYDGDSVAKQILDNNMKSIAELISTAAKELTSDRIQVIFAGGLSDKHNILFPMIREHLPNYKRFDFKVLPHSPVYGDILIAKQLNKTKETGNE